MSLLKTGLLIWNKTLPSLSVRRITESVTATYRSQLVVTVCCANWSTPWPSNVAISSSITRLYEFKLAAENAVIKTVVKTIKTTAHQHVLQRSKDACVLRRLIMHLKPIALATHGFNVLSLRVQFLTQITNIHVDDIRISRCVESPHTFQQIVARTR